MGPPGAAPKHTDELALQHPLGNRYITRLYANFVVYILVTISQLWLAQKSDKKNGSRRVLPLLLGWFDAQHPVESALTVLVNFLCIGAVLDFLYRGQILHQSNNLSFCRIGYVDETSARLIIRSPSHDAASSIEMSLRLAVGPGTKLTTQIISVSRENDFVGTYTFSGLDAGKTYAYETNASHSGVFTTSKSSPKTWSLITSSCIKPFYPYNPLDSALRVRGLEYLDSFIASNPVDMMLFLGDFIYIDLPIALGWTAEHYTTAYRQVYASKSWTERLRALPWIHAYDDHEIINDWSANETGLYQSAMRPFWNYHGNGNPVSQFGKSKTHFIFNRGDISLFVLDTRRYRTANNAPDGPEKTMLGAAQLADLRRWLKREKRWKVVVSSVPFTRNWRGPDAADSWSGYLHERDRILEIMKQTDGVIILSGVRRFALLLRLWLSIRI